MNKKIKEYLKKFPWTVKLYRFKTRASWWLSDVRSALLSKSTKLKKTPYGFKLKGTNSIHHIGMQEGVFEADEVGLFKDIFKSKDVFVDIGANIGFYSCLAMQAELHVIAVEPLQKNLDYLYSNLFRKYSNKFYFENMESNYHNDRQEHIDLCQTDLDVFL